MTQSSKGHLRLVSSNAKLAPLYVEPEQLTLPYMEPSSIVLANVQHFDRYEFLRFLLSVRPHWIIDLRIAPRFDQIAGLRSNAFLIFSSLGATYIDLLGQMNVKSYSASEVSPNYWGRAIFQMIYDSKAHRGPFVFLFERTELLMASKSLLAQKCQAVFKTQSPPPIFECRTDSDLSALK